MKTQEELNEYNRKMNIYKTSEASHQVKTEAMAKLKSEFFGVDMRNESIHRDIEAGAAEAPKAD